MTDDSQATTTRDPKPNRAERWIAEPNLEGEGGMIHDTLTGVFVSPTGYGDPWEICKQQAAEFNAKEATNTQAEQLLRELVDSLDEVENGEYGAANVSEERFLKRLAAARNYLSEGGV